QLTDAMHDEGDLRAVPLQAPRRADRQGVLRLLLLRSGPADGSDGLGEFAHAPAREFPAGKALRALARPLATAGEPPPGLSLLCIGRHGAAGLHGGRLLRGPDRRRAPARQKFAGTAVYRGDRGLRECDLLALALGLDVHA